MSRGDPSQASDGWGPLLPPGTVLVRAETIHGRPGELLLQPNKTEGGLRIFWTGENLSLSNFETVHRVKAGKVLLATPTGPPQYWVDAVAWYMVSGEVCAVRCLDELVEVLRGDVGAGGGDYAHTFGLKDTGAGWLDWLNLPSFGGPPPIVRSTDNVTDEELASVLSYDAERMLIGNYTWKPSRS